MNTGKLDILTIGHILVDIRIQVDHIPGPDDEARIIMETRGVGGSAANVAIAAKRLGATSGVVAKIGLDDFGRIAVDGLMREGVDITGLSVSLTRRTGFSIVSMNPQGSIAIYSYKGAAEGLEPMDLPVHLLSRARHVHIASLRPDTSLEAAKAARMAGTTVSWDPGRVLARRGLQRLSEMIRNVDIVLVNRREAESLTGVGGPVEAARLIHDLGPTMVVVKLGGEGALILHKGRVYRVRAFKPERVVDTTGAGDAFAAGLMVGLLRGYSVEKAGIYASLVASLKVARLGSHEAPSQGEVLEAARRAGLEL